MAWNAFFIRLMFLALPGVLGSMLFRKLRGRRPRQNWEAFLEFMLFSLAAYAVYGIILELRARLAPSVSSVTPPDASSVASPGVAALEALLDQTKPLEWGEILYASAIALMLAVVASYLDSYKCIDRFARRIRATNRCGDDDVWDLLQNSPEVDWVFVRDHKLGLLYFAWIGAFSDSEKERELLLQDVRVHSNDTGEFLYATKAMYLSRGKYDLTIEIPHVHVEGTDEQRGFEENEDVQEG